MGKLLAALLGLCAGLGIGYYLVVYTPVFSDRFHSPLSELLPHKRQVIGFLPYWLTSKADPNFPDYVTTLTYFGLTVESDGTIQTHANEQEENPGWHALRAGGVDPFLDSAQQHGLTKSLLVFNGDQDSIGQLISEPVPHARTLVGEVEPIMKKHGFTDLNLDIESVAEASPEARIHFTEFVREVRRQLDERRLGTLTIEASPTVLIKPYLIDATAVAPLVDTFVFMTYDYHYQGSAVTGPVAPLRGAGTVSEFDTEVAMEKALEVMPPSKIIIGVPLYGYEWETISSEPRSAVIPGTGVTASNARVEKFLTECATCSAQTDQTDQESYVVYRDTETDTYHQIFFPDSGSMKAKMKLTEDLRLGGVALWALGYEGSSLLTPLKDW